MTAAKKAAWKVPLDVIASALMLPDDVEIMAASQTPTDSQSRVCSLLLVGAGLPDSYRTWDEAAEILGRYIDQHGRVRLFLQAPDEADVK